MKDWQFEKMLNHKVSKVKAKFNGMFARCYNAELKVFKSYGGRGITICDNWLKHPDLFILWSLQNGYFEHCHIHRLNTHLGYTPDNCIFLSRQAHMRLHIEMRQADKRFVLDGENHNRSKQEENLVKYDFSVLKGVR